MKVLFANKFFYLNGGAERVFLQEREFLVKKKVKVVDFSMQDKKNLKSSYSEYFVNNINFSASRGYYHKLKIVTSFVHSFEAVVNLARLLEKERPNLAHLHNIYHQLTPSIIPLLKKKGVKVVLTLHDYKLICPSYLALNGNSICTACDGRYFWKSINQHCQNSRSREFLLCMEAYFHKWRKSYEEVDLYLAPSQFMADIVSRRIPSKKIVVLPNGIDTDELYPQYTDEGYALYFGRISREKGIETLLAAYDQLDSPIPLRVVGTGPLRVSLQSKHPDVDFLGYKSGQDLHDLIANASFVVVPSEWYENCSMAVLEAMAFGKPVLGARIGGIPEQVEDGRTGFLFAMGNHFELAEKIEVLSQDTALRKNMGLAARQKLEQQYSLSSHNEQLLQIYKTLLGH